MTDRPLPASRITAALERPDRGGVSSPTGLVPYVTAGYPSLDATLEMLVGFERAGARAVEIGIPFSDPIADGPDIQRASEWAMRAHVGAAETLALVERFRRTSRLPVVVMTYANPAVRLGADAFAARAREAGVDGVLVSDLPPEELPDFWAALDREALDTIVLIAPTTEDERLPALLARARGFVYCLTRTGITGRGPGDAGALDERVARVRARTTLPIALGFGISTPDDAAALRGRAEALVVGAAFMRCVAEDPSNGAAERVIRRAGEFVAALR